MKRELNEIEVKCLKAMNNVVFLPASYDKRFFRSIGEGIEYSEKQINYFHFIFNKYRKQIKNYEQLAFELSPDRFKVNVIYEKDLFSINGKAEITFEDTFKPRRLINS